MKSVFIGLAASFSFLLSSYAEEWKMQVPALAPVSFSLPGGKERIEFVFVPVEKSASSYSAVEFLIGKDNASIDSPVSYAYVSGNIYKGGVWYLLVGKTEVTNGQYAAVTGEPLPPGMPPDFPKTNVTRVDVARFMAKLNELLIRDNKKTLQQLTGKRENSPMHGMPFARLLTESEWEFCARGGRQVEKDIFESAYPYADAAGKTGETSVYEYENLDSGNGSAALSAVAGKKPGPCGLYDMLGNVAEFVEQNFTASYLLGRTGGVLTRGGAWNLGWENMSADTDRFAAYARREFKPYRSDGGMFKSPDVGFRLTLGSRVLVSVTEQDDAGMIRDREEWYRLHHSKVAVRVGNTNSEIIQDDTGRLKEENERLSAKLHRADKELRDAAGGGRDHEARLERQMKSMAQEMERLQKRAAQLEEFSRQSQEEAVRNSLHAGVMLMSAACHYAAMDFKKIVAHTRYLESTGASREECDRDRNLKYLRANIEDYYRNFRTACELLSQMDEQRVRGALVQEIGKTAANPLQQQSLNAGKKCYETYRNNRRWNNAMLQLWTDELSKIK